MSCVATACFVLKWTKKVPLATPARVMVATMMTLGKQTGASRMLSLGAALYFASNPSPVPLVDGSRPLVEANLAFAGHGAATRRPPPRDGR